MDDGGVYVNNVDVKYLKIYRMDLEMAYRNFIDTIKQWLISLLFYQLLIYTLLLINVLLFLLVFYTIYHKNNYSLILCLDNDML